MPMSKPHLVQKVLSVPKDDAQWFEENYPDYGAWTWWVRESLRKFRELHEITPREIMNEAQGEVFADVKVHGIVR